MKEFVIVLTIAGALLGASHTLGQSEKPVAPNYKGDALVYTDLAKAPDKAKAKRSPMENDLNAVAAGQNLFEQHYAWNATVAPVTAQKKLLASASRKCRTRHRELFFGFSRTAWSAAACLSGQNCPSHRGGSSLASLSRSAPRRKPLKRCWIERAVLRSFGLWSHAMNFEGVPPEVGACVAPALNS